MELSPTAPTGHDFVSLEKRTPQVQQLMGGCGTWPEHTAPSAGRQQDRLWPRHRKTGEARQEDGGRLGGPDSALHGRLPGERPLLPTAGQRHDGEGQSSAAKPCASCLGPAVGVPHLPQCPGRSLRGPGEQPPDVARCHHPVLLPWVSNAPIQSGTVHPGPGRPWHRGQVSAHLPLSCHQAPITRLSSPKAHCGPWTRPSSLMGAQNTDPGLQPSPARPSHITPGALAVPRPPCDLTPCRGAVRTLIPHASEPARSQTSATKLPSS